MKPSVQERFANHTTCYGCGPSNTKGLRIRSFENETGLECDFTPELYHEAFPGVVSGGILGTILDCHSNWTACCHLMKRDALSKPPCTVTAWFKVSMLKPTPSHQGPLKVLARPVHSEGSRVTIEAQVQVGGEVTATCEGLFVAVKPGHPAYGRW